MPEGRYIAYYRVCTAPTPLNLSLARSCQRRFWVIRKPADRPVSAVTWCWVNVKFGAKETVDAHEMQIEVALGETRPMGPAGPPGSVSSITKATNLGGGAGCDAVEAACLTTSHRDWVCFQCALYRGAGPGFRHYLTFPGTPPRP